MVLGEGQTHGEDRTFTERARCGNRSVVGLDNLLRDIKSKTEPADIAR
jgi:hypothetical protein